MFKVVRISVVFLMFLFSCNDPLTEIVDGDKAQPETHPHEQSEDRDFGDPK